MQCNVPEKERYKKEKEVYFDHFSVQILRSFSFQANWTFFASLRNAGCCSATDCVGGGRCWGEFEEVARMRDRASAGKQSMLGRKMGRKARSAQRGEGGRERGRGRPMLGRPAHFYGQNGGAG